MLSPEFPYKGNQIILASERVVLDAKTDGIFLFGKRMIALASNETINLDAKEAIYIDSDTIELGHKAKDLGDPIILGKKFVDEFNLLLEGMQYLASNLTSVSKTGDSASWIAIQDGGLKLHRACARLITILNNPVDDKYPLSKNTFTR
jgi:hypothetical protein